MNDEMCVGSFLIRSAVKIDWMHGILMAFINVTIRWPFYSWHNFWVLCFYLRHGKRITRQLPFLFVKLLLINGWVVPGDLNVTVYINQYGGQVYLQLGGGWSTCHPLLRPLHLNSIHRGVLAIWAPGLQIFRIYQGRIHRSIRLHIDSSFSGSVLCHNWSDEKASREEGNEDHLYYNSRYVIQHLESLMIVGQ